MRLGGEGEAVPLREVLEALPGGLFESAQAVADQASATGRARKPQPGGGARGEP